MSNHFKLKDIFFLCMFRHYSILSLSLHFDAPCYICFSLRSVLYVLLSTRHMFLDQCHLHVSFHEYLHSV